MPRGVHTDQPHSLSLRPPPVSAGGPGPLQADLQPGTRHEFDRTGHDQRCVPPPASGNINCFLVPERAQRTILRGMTRDEPITARVAPQGPPAPWGAGLIFFSLESGPASSGFAVLTLGGPAGSVRAAR